MKRVFEFSYNHCCIFFRWALVFGLVRTWDFTRQFSFSVVTHTVLIPGINSRVLP